MNKFAILIFFCFLGFTSKAQDFNELPPYHLLKTDSSYITPANLKKNTKLLVIYFGADCNHCKLYTKELLKHMDVLSRVPILMITWSSLTMIKGFYDEMGLKKYPNFTVATEGNNYTLYRFYHVKTTPYTAVYNTNHRLVKVFDKSPVIDSLLAVVKK